jgi:hypothetical protein
MTNLRTIATLSGVAILSTVSGCMAQNAPLTPQNAPVAASAAAKTATNPLMQTPNIGVGLEGLADWSRAQMFADVMKTSRAWGKVDQPWVQEVKTDALGWPLEDAGVIAMADATDIDGTYQLSFDGKADVRGHSRVKIENLAYDAATKRSTAQVIVPKGETQIFLSFTGTNGGVKNVKLLRPGSAPNATFSKPFLDKLQPFGTMRFMDFLSTNNNPLTKWENRTTPAHASQARGEGGALEYVVELANLTGKDIWVNVPDKLDDAGARQMATMLKNGLKPNIKVYVEWSNEVWNWQFQQANNNLAAAKIEGKEANSPLAFDKDTNEGYWGMRRIAQRSVQIGQIFREVFGDKDMSRVRPVYATQVGYEEVYKQGLMFLENQYKQPNTVLYAIAGAPYFQVSEELNKKKDLTVDEIFEGIPADMKKNLDQAATLGSYARYYGLKHLAYEGGQHLQDHHDVGNSDAKVAANRDPRMGQAMETYLRGWHALGGDLFMYFTLTSGYGKWGSWGLVDDVTKSSPKYEAAVKVAKAAPIPLTVGTPVPGEIKAGDFMGTSSWDKRGEAQVGIEAKKWINYQIRVPKAGNYQLTAQISGGEAAQAEVLVNSKSQGNLQIAANAPTATLALPLEAGLNVIRVLGREGRFSLKSLSVAAG